MKSQPTLVSRTRSCLVAAVVALPMLEGGLIAEPSFSKQVQTRQAEAPSRTTSDLQHCGLLANAAKSERNWKRRNELFDGALKAYDEFLGENPLDEGVTRAQLEFIALSNLYAVALERSLLRCTNEEQEGLRKTHKDVLTVANDRARFLIDDLQNLYEAEPNEELKQQVVEAMMRRGESNLRLGRSIETGIHYFSEARRVLETCVFFAGPETPVALRAYDMIGQTLSAEEQWGTASIYYQSVIDATIPTGLKAWDAIVKNLELSQADKEQRWLFVELATGGLVEALDAGGDRWGRPSTRCILSIPIDAKV